MGWWDFPLNLVADKPPWAVFLIGLGVGWTLSPGLFMGIGWLFESRRIPLSPKRQFLGFFPGDLMLGLLFAGLLAMSTELPLGAAWFQAWMSVVRPVVLIGAIVAAIGLTILELFSSTYTRGQVLSPTKLYHNIVLWMVYGYVIVTTLFAVIIGGLSWWLALVVGPGVVWAICNVVDTIPTYPGDVPMRRKGEHAHVADWKPRWVR